MVAARRRTDVGPAAWIGPVSWRKPMTFGSSFGLTLIAITRGRPTCSSHPGPRAGLLGLFAAACTLEVVLIALLTVAAFRGPVSGPAGMATAVRADRSPAAQDRLVRRAALGYTVVFALALAWSVARLVRLET